MSSLTHRFFRGKRISSFLSLLILSLFLVSCSAAPQGWAGAAVSSTQAFIVATDGKVHGLDLTARSRGDAFPATGEWVYPADKDTKLGPAYAAPLYADGKVYVGIYSYKQPHTGKVFALEASTGKELWQFPQDNSGVGNIVGDLALANGTLYVGTADESVYAIRADNGQMKWRFKAGNKVWAGVAFDQKGTVYAASLDHSIYALAEADGAKKWSFTTDGSIASAPLYADGTVYFGAGDDKLYALNSDTGAKRWEFGTGGWVWGSPFLSQGTIYIGTLNNEVYAIDASTGRPQWGQPFRAAGPISATLSTASNMLIVPAQDGKVYGLDLATGIQRWAYSSDPVGPIYAAPAIQGTTLYVAPFNQRLIALDSTNGTPKWVYRTQN